MSDLDLDRHEPRIPRGGQQTDLGAPGMLDMLSMALRLLTGGVGAVLMIGGLVLAFQVFGFVRDTVVAPERLTAYLDGWEQSLRVREAEVADSEAAVQPGIPSEDAPPPEATEAAAEVADDAEFQLLESGAPKTEAVLPAQQKPAPPQPPMQRRTAASRAAKLRTANATPWGEVALELIDAVRSGLVARIIAASFVLLFTLVLVRIPFTLIRMGAKVALAAAKKQGPPKTPDWSD